MNFHFIWFGSNPHSELFEKIVNKARYLGAFFNAQINYFYIWTTNDLINRINHKIFHFPTSNIKLEVKSIDAIFSLNNANFDLKYLYKLFLMESNGALHNNAVAADLIKFLTLFHYGGIYVDAGLELHLNKNKGASLFVKNYLKYDYGCVGNEVREYSNFAQYDLQILYSSSSSNARKFLFNVLQECINLMKDTLPFYFNSIRKARNSKASFNKDYSWTCDTYNFILKNRLRKDKIYLFKKTRDELAKNEYFLDFPSIYLKNISQQKYENYRTRIPRTMDL